MPDRLLQGLLDVHLKFNEFMIREEVCVIYRPIRVQLKDVRVYKQNIYDGFRSTCDEGRLAASVENAQVVSANDVLKCVTPCIVNRTAPAFAVSVRVCT